MSPEILRTFLNLTTMQLAQLQEIFFFLVVLIFLNQGFLLAGQSLYHLSHTLNCI
jgi:hypothetical protein